MSNSDVKADCTSGEDVPTQSHLNPPIHPSLPAARAVTTTHTGAQAQDGCDRSGQNGAVQQAVASERGLRDCGLRDSALQRSSQYQDEGINLDWGGRESEFRSLLEPDVDDGQFRTRGGEGSGGEGSVRVAGEGLCTEGTRGRNWRFGFFLLAIVVVSVSTNSVLVSVTVGLALWCACVRESMAVEKRKKRKKKSTLSFDFYLSLLFRHAFPHIYSLSQTIPTTLPPPFSDVTLNLQIQVKLPFTAVRHTLDTCTHAHARTRTHAHARTHAPTHIRARTYTRKHALTHTHTHTHTLPITYKDWSRGEDLDSYVQKDINHI